jgi:23S rRNA pseudouridine2605 synthase
MRKQKHPEIETAPPERLQKVMASAGLGSRRALEKQIGNGDVLCNGETAVLGQTVSIGDSILFKQTQWRVVSKPVQHRCLIYNKPLGEISTRSDPNGRPTVYDRLPTVRNARWVAIGRLDINTTGLLLLTTDGEFAHVMMHPSSNVDREYACRIRGEVAAGQLQNLRQGVELDDGPACFSDIQEAGGSGENHWFHVTIMEGRKREVRRLWESQGLTVSRLKRVRYGAAFLPKRLQMGKWSEISARDLQILREDVGLPSEGKSLSLQFIKGPGKQVGKQIAKSKSRPGSSPRNGKQTAKSKFRPGSSPRKGKRSGKK